MQYLPLACFGKAPCDLEYLEYNVSYPSSRKLKSWIRDGFKLARMAPDGEGSREFRESRNCGFLVGGPDANEWVAGIIGPSTDEYPRENVLAVFTHLPRRPYAKSYHLLPLALTSVWHAIDDARSHLLEVSTLDSFEDYLLSTRVPAPSDPNHSKNEYKATQREAFHRIFDRADGADPESLQAQLPQVVAGLRKVKGGGSFAVELPVSTERSDACFDASFWIDLLNHQFLWHRFQPAVFLPLDPVNDRRTVVLVFGGLGPELYASIMGDVTENGLVLRPAAASRGETPDGATDSPAPQTPDAAGASAGGASATDGGMATDPTPSFAEVLSRKIASG